jgi:hypothetical protein
MLKRLIQLSCILFFFSLVAACSGSNHAPISNANGNGSYSENRQHKFNKLQFNGYICENAYQYKGAYLGNGECVDLVKLCSHAPHTRSWQKGSSVFGNNIPTGTAIATFRNGKYPNKSGHHAAIYSHQNNDGIFVWDQWRGQRVHLRFIKAHQPHKKAGNDASRYRIINR